MDHKLFRNGRRQENMFLLIDRLITFESEHGIRFNEDGLPIPEEWMFLKETPNDILPYDHRLDAEEPKKVAVCFFQKDQCLYRRLTMAKLESTAKEVAKYQGFCGFDLSIFSDMLTPFQDFYVLANMVIDIYFCLRGARLIPNLRADKNDGGSYFHLYSSAPVVCCGTLGCSCRKDIKRKNVEQISAYAEAHPNQVLIQYGSDLCKGRNIIFIKGYGRWRRHE